MSGRVRVWVVLLLVPGGLLVGPETGLAPPKPTLAGQPSYALGCGFSHRNNDDPIALPGQPGRSHSHTYIGNRSVDASSTPASLRGGRSTCHDDGDASAYWVPTLSADGDALRPLFGLAYYVKRTVDPMHPLPAGLKMIAGDADARRPQSTAIVSWTCGGVASPRRFPTVPPCASSLPFQLRVDFPNCWNGRSTDSADHKRHMAYSSAGRCPSSHPVPVPTLTLVLLYAPVRGRVELSSGRFAAHADFMNGWDQEVLAGQVVALNRSRLADD